MPLPLASCPENVPSNVCCDTFWLMGERIRTVALDAVCSCIDPTCQGQEIESWSTEGDRSGAVRGDSLIVSFVGAGLRTDSRGRQGNVSPITVTRATFRVELNEVGWPMVREHAAAQSILLPDPQLVHAIAKHARGHAEKMWRALLNGTAHTNPVQLIFQPALHPFIIHRGVALGDLTSRVSGPHVTYTTTMTVDCTLA